MDLAVFMGQMGMALAIGMAAVGSSVGAGLAGMSAAGAWAKDSKAGKPLRFIYVILVSAPITQTVYGFLVANQMAVVLTDPAKMAKYGGAMLAIGIGTGLGEMLSAWFQGAIGAAGCRMLSETDGKGFAFILIALGIAETVGIFTLVFMSIMLAKLG